MMKRYPLAALLMVAAFQVGCGKPLPPPQTIPPAKQQKPAAVRLNMEPIKLQARQADGATKIEVLDAASLFDHGGQLLSAKKYRQALSYYNKLLKHFPGSRYVSSTLYNSGLCHEWLGEFQQAVGRYKELVRISQGRKEAVDAGFRLGGCYAELRNWPAAAEVFKVFARRKDLSSSDRIEAMARMGLAYFRLGDGQRAKSIFKEAIAFNKSIETVERLDSDFFVAMSNYYLAALPHVAFRKLKVDPQMMARTLDEKARLLLLSQSGYIRTIKAKNPYWASAAGFQVGSLYREFYTTLLTSLPNFTSQSKKNSRLSGVSQEEAHKQLVQVYMEEVHKAVKPLLSKAIRVFAKNILMAERVGIQSNWVRKSQHQVNELKHLLTIPPQEAIKLVPKEGVIPENQPGVDPPPETPEKDKDKGGDKDVEPGEKSVDPAPTTPSHTPPGPPPEEPGRAIL